MTASDPTDIALRAVNLRKTLGGRAVLRGASLELARGACAVLLAPNGAGKTTLLQTLGLIYEPGGGFLDVLGTRIAPGCPERVRAAVRARVGLVRQRPLFEAAASCAENVEPIALFRGLVHRARRRAEVAEALTLAGVGRRVDHPAGTLNGGDRLRLAISQAIVGLDRGVLLLDEPTASLSSQSASEILDLLHRLNRDRGLTILAATHDDAWAARLAPAREHYRLAAGRLGRLDDQTHPEPAPAAHVGLPKPENCA